MRYGTNRPEGLPKRILKGLLYYIIGVVMNMWFVTVMTGLMMENLFIKLAVGIAAEVIVNGLFFNYAYNAACLDRELVKFHGMEKDRYMSLKMALTAPVLGYVMTVMLGLAKAGAFDGTLLGERGFNYYILLNLHALPWIAMFTDERSIEHLTWAGYAGIVFLQLIEPAVIALTYELTFRNIDIKEKFLYGKKNTDKKA